MPRPTHETAQEMLLRDIQTYKEHLAWVHTQITHLRQEFEITRNDVQTLRKLCEGNPTDEAAKTRLKNASERLARLHHDLFEDPDNLKVMEEVPEIEKDLMNANAAFLRSLH